MICKQEIINAADSPSIWPLHCLPSFEKTECQALPTCEWSLLIWWQEHHRLWLGTSMLAWVFNSCIRLIPQRLADCNLHSIPGKVHVLMLLRRIRDHLLRHQKREQSNSLPPNPRSLHRPKLHQESAQEIPTLRDTLSDHRPSSKPPFQQWKLGEWVLARFKPKN